MNIAVDIDGVLLDWAARVREVYPHQKSEVPKTWDGFLPEGVDKEVFWKHMASSPEFYGGVVPTPWAYELINFLNGTGHNWFFATACSQGSVGPKANCIQRYFGPIKGIFFLEGTSKTDHRYDLLIDDHPELVGKEKVVSLPTTYNTAHGPERPMKIRMECFWSELKTRTQ